MSLSGEDLYRKILDLRSPVTAKRFDSIDHIPVIVDRLGPERTTLEFLPYLFETSGYSGKMLQMILSKIEKLNLSRFSAAQIDQLFHTLIDEVTTYESPNLHKELAGCIAAIYQAHKSESLIDHVEKVIGSDWLSEQIYAYAIIARLIPIVDDDSRARLLSLLFEHAEKSSAMSLIRKAAISAFSDIIQATDKGVDVDKMIEIIELFAEDESPTIACEIPSFLSVYLRATGDIESVNGVYEKLLQSKVWRVVLFAIMGMGSIYEDAANREHLIPFLKDASENTEEEIRIAGCKQLPLVLDVSGGDDLCNNYMNDKSEKVRLVFVEVVGKHPDPEYVSTALMTMLHDPNSAVVLAAINALNERKFSSNVMNKGLLDFLAGCKDYRGRRSIVQAIPGLKIQCSPELVKLIVTDESIAVRYAAIDVLTRIGFSDDYKAIVEELFKSDDYQMQQTAIVLVSRLNLWDSYEREIEALASHPVSNVRLTVAKRIPATFRKLLEKLKQDKDEDVRDVAAQNK